MLEAGERDADVVLLLHHLSDPDAEQQPGRLAEVAVYAAKGRNVGRGSAKVFFDGQRVAFRNWFPHAAEDFA